MRDHKEALVKYHSEIFEAAPIGMAIAALDGTILKLNKEFSKTTGYSSDELLNKSFTWFTHPEDLSLNLEKNKAVITGKLPSHQMEKRYFHKNGNIIHILLKVTALKDEEGTPEFLLAQIVDITERVKYSDEKERSEKHFRQIFDKAPIGKALVDLDLNFIEVNNALCELLKYSKHELEKLSIKDVTHPDDLSDNIQNDTNLIAGKSESFTMEKRYIRKDGEVIEGLLKVSVVKDNTGKSSHLIGQVVDITQLKSYEKQLHKNIEKLIKANREIDSFIYHASHDLKGPLATIKGLLNLHDTGLTGDVILPKIAASINKMEHAISVLSDYSANTSLRINKEEVNIKNYLKSIVDEFLAEAGKKNLKITTDSPSISVSVDVTRINIILKHVIQNAIYYHNKPTDGYISVMCTEQFDNLKIVIEDNGSGMDDEIKSKAFDMFYRGNEGSQGIGMGLYIVKEAISKLDGEIKFISLPGEGTRFFITLPVY